MDVCAIMYTCHTHFARRTLWFAVINSFLTAGPGVTDSIAPLLHAAPITLFRCRELVTLCVGHLVVSAEVFFPGLLSPLFIASISNNIHTLIASGMRPQLQQTKRVNQLHMPWASTEVDQAPQPQSAMQEIELSLPRATNLNYHSWILMSIWGQARPQK